MTKRQGKSGTIDVKAVLSEDEELLRALVRTALQEVLETEMTEALGAEKGERAAGRQGYRSGYYGRTLITRVGKLELRVPQDRTGRFSTELFERYQRSERALVAALAEMYVQGVSTRKVKAITEELCGHSFSASSISAMNQRLDASLAQFAGRPLAEAFPYLILDARYERVREAGVIASQAVLIAIGIDWDGRRQVLAVELANRESRSSWRDFLLGLKTRGLHGVEFVVADDHAGLRAALREVLAEAAYQRCYVHFLRNALDHVPRRVDDDCLRELRWLYDRRDLIEARRDLAAWLTKWSGKYSKLTGWVEDNIDETLTFYRLPRQHHKHLKSTDEIDKSFFGWLASTGRLSRGHGSPSVRRRHGGQEGCWDAALSTPTAAEGGGRRPAFTKPHPSSDNRPWRSAGCPVQKPQPLVPRTARFETHLVCAVVS